MTHLFFEENVLKNQWRELMKKSIFLFSLILLCFAFSNKAHAQMFQNTNAACESINLLTTSASVACKYFNPNVTNYFYSGADFTGDAFTDCVAVTTSTTAPQASVLLNRGTSAVSCASGSGDQFQAPINYNIGVIGTSDTMATVTAGPIAHSYNASPAPNSDFAVPETGLGAPKDLYTANSIAGGGFGVSPITPSIVTWNTTATQLAFSNDVAEKNAALFDCDGDGNLDEVIVVRDTGGSGSFTLNVSLNEGSGLTAVAAATVFDTHISSVAANAPVASVAIGNFSGSSLPEVAVSIDDGTTGVVQVCVNDSTVGTCHLTCPNTPTINLNNFHASNIDPNPTSIVAGDFNGDGNTDIAVNAPNQRSPGIDFFFGDGSGAFPTHTFVTAMSLNSAAANNTVPRVLTTGCFNNDNNVDVATTVDGISSQSVGVITTDSSNTQTVTQLSFGAAVTDVEGIDAADFDGQGGDDIIALANTGNVVTGFVFMNAIENIVANAGADITSATNVVQLTGTCAMNPADATAVFAPTWTIVSPATGGTLTNATTLTPTLTTTTDGIYTVRLTCRSRCKDTATDTVTVTTATVNNLLLEGDGRLGHPGCMLNPLAPFSISGMLMMFSGLGILWSFRRQKK